MLRLVVYGRPYEHPVGSATLPESLFVSTMTNHSGEPALVRADARRNRHRILAAARAAFATQDAPPSLAEICRRAGVGMATLYRNFPTRLDLLEALYAAEVDAAFSPVTPEPDAAPAEALRRWLSQFFAFAASKKHIAAELLTHRDSASPIFADTKTRVTAVGGPLFDAAQRADLIRADLRLEQVLQLLVSIAAMDGSPADQTPILLTVLDGLETPTARGRHT